jgi:hypothetical protein
MKHFDTFSSGLSAQNAAQKLASHYGPIMTLGMR